MALGLLGEPDVGGREPECLFRSDCPERYPEAVSEAKRDAILEDPEPEETRLPPPVPGGTGYVESLGKWIDNLLGAERDRKHAEAALRPHYLREDEMPDDPPPEEAPPPVPDGTGVVERGKRPRHLRTSS